jgi:hypothetical protein
LRGRLQIGANAFDGSRAGVAAVAEVEDESRISDRVAAKSGRSRVITAQEFLHFSEQMHLVVSL